MTRQPHPDVTRADVERIVRRDFPEARVEEVLMDHSRVVVALDEHGLLLLQDKKLQNAVQIITGGAVRGSWWSHPSAHAIYAILEQIAEHPDVLVAKLVSKKVTLVHRRLWPAFLAVATGREPWQLEDLSKDAEQMLAKLDEGSTIEPAGSTGKEIELRLLAYALKVHTASGKHVSRLEPWPTWARKTDCTAIAVPEAKQQLESAVIGIGGAPKLLPWYSFRPADVAG